MRHYTEAVEAMQAMENPTPVTFLPVVSDTKSMKLEGLVTLHGKASRGLSCQVSGEGGCTGL